MYEGGREHVAAMSILTRLEAWLFGPPRPASPAEQESPEEEASGGTLYVQPIEASIDLHHFAPKDIPSVVVEYLREARAHGLEEVRLIHGRGKGIQRRRVQVILSRHRHVISFRSDGLGSTIARLDPSAEKTPGALRARLELRRGRG